MPNESRDNTTLAIDSQAHHYFNWLRSESSTSTSALMQNTFVFSFFEKDTETFVIIASVMKSRES
jgi:hypothetical protein